MAQGSVTCFEEFTKYIGDGSHDLNSDSFKIALLTTAPTASDATPDYSDYSGNEVSGTGYTAAGASATLTWTEAAGTATLALGSNVTWSQNGAGPTNINYGLLYNTTHAGTNDAIAFIDMRDGGTTAISLQDGDVTINSGTIFTLAV